MTEKAINLNDKTCLNREDRIGSIKAYYGNASDIIKDTRNCDLKWKDRRFQQNGGCVLTAGLHRLATVLYAVIVNHAPIGCASMLYGYREVYANIPEALGRPPIDFHWISSNLSDKDIVFGVNLN